MARFDGIEWLAIAGAVASALSAAAAWAAVRQVRETLRESRRPRLVASYAQAADGTVQFLIQNAGQGTAVVARYYFRSSGRIMGGELIGEGIISPGERWRLETVIPLTTTTAEGIWFCESVEGEFFAWALNDK